MSRGFFSKQLLNWHRNDNERELPWKGERDPYKIWLSEIILQQTRAEQGLPYYERFVNTYPSIDDLAVASEQAVFKLWEGLGYYSRCRNLIATARYIAHELSGVFPTSYEGLLKLKGVGPYTAAAIASFAFGLPRPVVDGNVYRVLSRFFADPTPIDTTEGKKHYTRSVEEVFDPEHAAEFNQAIMDLGASVCTPRSPKCGDCYLSGHCKALADNIVDAFPIKSKKIGVKRRSFQYWVLKHGSQVYLQRRDAKDVWQQLHEFYLVETESGTLPSELGIGDLIRSRQDVRFVYKQRLTHQLIESRFHILELNNKPASGLEEGFWIEVAEIRKYAFPKTIVSFLEEIDYF